MAKIKSPLEIQQMRVTEKSADGTTTLKRFDVTGVIYAPNEREARSRLEHCLEIDAASIAEWAAS